ncbi:DUF1217 domain-containing protein [Shinella sp. CPCC 101442]|uniref:DUF1217 domain-containing protein n=1 Tax=Shinella sp. CPCC 101442 TaxID=2932265 RepID=UPI0021539172|nr:DUF1217 domain-containing protein [Shinella sp. CPCC 101442]MCR6499200.1 DUF1217 domain-containing protein [Shinella sp. CPCC 101442]
MLSTYTSYNLIANDMLKSLNRTATETVNARDAAYYKENIGKVASVDEFLDDYRLYSYAVKAFGLEEMTYAKAFMKKVLDSDLTDSASFANSLTDERYRNFAAAFSFAASTASAQTEVQLDETIGLYTATANNAGDGIKEETRYYNIVIDSTTNVDQFINNERMRNYMFTSYGIDPGTYSRATIRGVLTSDLNDPASYFNTQFEAKKTVAVAAIQTAADELSTLTNNATNAARIAQLKAEITKQNAVITGVEKYRILAEAYNFNTDGTATAGTVQSASQKAGTNQLYTLSNPRVTSAAALLNQAYFEEKIGSISTVSELVSDARVVSYLKTAFGLDKLSVVSSTITNILTSSADPSDTTSYINVFGAEDKAAYFALRNVFNFQEDGTLAAGDAAQTAAQTATTGRAYMNTYNDKDEEADATAIKRFKSQISAVKTVTDFVNEATIYDFALKAFGIDPTKVSVLTIKNVLKSDLNDPKSYVYQLKDERYVELAKAFNFDAKGNISAPKLAQSEAEIIVTSRAYVTEKSRFGTEDDKTAAQEEAKYYSVQMQKIESVDELLSDKRLVNFVLEANDIKPESVDSEFLKKIFASDLDDPKSFANQQADRSYRKIVASFNFNAEGKVEEPDDAQIQSRRGIYETIDSYLRQMLEEEAGNDNAGVRLALYFERKADTVSSAYDILADDALFEVFKVLFQLPDEVGSADIDAQADMVNRYLELEDLQDPEKVAKMIVKFSVLYDLDNQSTPNPALSVLTSSGSSGISAETMMSLAQLRTGG